MRVKTWEVHAGGLESNAMISLADRGFRFGQHLFETIAVRCGKWLFFHEHLDILKQSAKDAAFQCNIGVLDALDSLPECLEMNSLQEGIARIYWTAGEGNPATPSSLGRIFLLWEQQPLPARQTTLKLLTKPHEFRPMGSSRGCWKTGNYWRNVIAREEAAAHGFDEILLATGKGEICSAAMGNIFYRIGKKWATPPLGEGVRPGTTRAWLLSKGFATEQPLFMNQLDEVEAWIVTNARLGPAPADSGSEQSEPDASVAELWQMWMSL